MELILASASDTRRSLLEVAGVTARIVPARIDEENVKAAMIDANASPRDVSDALAEAKARKVSARHPGALVLGCDQILDLDGTLMSKPSDQSAAKAQIRALSGRRHCLHSAIVAYEGVEPVWRHIGSVRLAMRVVGEAYLDDYVARNWDAIRHSVGSYQFEGEGMRLFSSIEGDYFTVLGMPMLPLLSWLTVRGYLPG